MPLASTQTLLFVLAKAVYQVQVIVNDPGYKRIEPIESLGCIQSVVQTREVMAAMEVVETAYAEALSIKATEEIDICRQCNGTGLAGQDACPACHGVGETTKVAGNA